MYEIRIYRKSANGKLRISKINKSGHWFGFFGWCRLWFTLGKSVRKQEEQYRGIAADCSPRIPCH
jgi:hypothetical protein